MSQTKFAKTFNALVNLASTALKATAEYEGGDAKVWYVHDGGSWWKDKDHIREVVRQSLETSLLEHAVGGLSFPFFLFVVSYGIFSNIFHITFPPLCLRPR